MSDAKAQQEPTMEEILASIRRIISEDEKPADEASAADGEAEVEEPELLAAAADTAAEDEDEDVLELTEVVGEDLDAAPEPLDDFDAPEPEMEPDLDFEPSPEPEPASYAEPVQAAAALHEAYRGLVSNPTAAHASSSFSQLAGAVTATRGVPLGAHQKTLEDLTKELLRPMLKEWLDRHLPPLVERLVEREIAKLAGSAEEK